MPPPSLSAVVRHIRTLSAPPESAEASDAQLLDRFRAAGDEAAFGTLVRRHGRMVMGVCRRVLRQEQDAEDAFQATFLVLARNAASIRKHAALASWLYGVAQRVAGDARRAAARRQTRERRAMKVAHEQPDLELAWRELQAVLAGEVQRLPEKYRAPFVLCCLEGKSKAEAAAQLGWKEGTISSRLAEARKRMQERLARRGLTLTAVLCAVAVAADTASAATALLTTTVSAARGAWAGTAAGVSARVAALANGVTKAMFASKVKTATALLLAVGLLATAAGTQIHRAFADPPAREAAPPQAAKPDQTPATKPEKADAPADPLPEGAVLRLGTTRLRPGGSIRHLVISPDGTKVAASSGSDLSIWDTRTGSLLRRVDLLGAWIASLAWLADGRGIAIVKGPDGWGPRVWEFTDEKATPTFPPRPGGGGVMAAPIPAVPPDNESDSCYAVSPDGKTLAIGRAGHHDKARPILLRPLKTDAAVRDLPEPKELARQPGNCKLLLFTPDGKRLVAFNQAKDLGGGKQEGEQLVVVWDLATGKETARFKAPRPAENGNPPAAATSDTTLAIGLEDGGTSLWDLATGKERKLATGHDSKKSGGGYGTFAVAFAPDGKTLATAGRDGVVKLCDVAAGRHLRSLERHYSWIEALAVSPDGRMVASSGQDGVIRLWDTATGKDACPQPGHLYTVSHAVLAPDGKMAITAGWDSTLRWWDTAAGRELRRVDLPGGADGLAISPDGRTVLATVNGKRLRTWDLATGRETTPADLPGGMQVGALAFTPDGRRLITASGPHVTILDWPGMKVRHSFDLPKPAKTPGENVCQWLAVSPDGRWLVTAAERSWFREENGLRFGYGADGVVDVWDLSTGQRVRRLAESQATFRTATFTADGRVVLAPGTGMIPAQEGRPEERFQGPIALLDPVTARWVRSFARRPGPARGDDSLGDRFLYVGATLLSPDGRTLYVSDSFGNIVCYEVTTGQPRRVLAGHRDYIGALGLSSDGRRLISGGRDASALIWDVTPAGAAKPRKEPLTAATADELWAALAGSEAQPAYAAMADLAAAPDRAAALLRRELKPAPAAPTDAELDRAFADLDSEDFATREKGSRQLAAFGEAAVPGVRKRLAKAESPEVRKRALEFLDRFDPATLSPDRLRQLRAVELLEGTATPAAKELLSELAKGARGAPLTLEAASALKRLGGD
jgi:RNA polymerase sigma factor (sigma-70 family)